MIAEYYCPWTVDDLAITVEVAERMGLDSNATMTALAANRREAKNSELLAMFFGTNVHASTTLARGE